MKTFATTIILIVVMTAAFTNDGRAQYASGMGSKIVGVNLSFLTNPYDLGFGADFEYGYDQNIGIGGVLRYWGTTTDVAVGSLTQSIVMIQAQGLYHFSPKEQVDPYAGVRLGYGFYSSSWTPNSQNPFASASGTGESGMILSILGGARYYFTPKISANGCLEFKLAGRDFFKDNLILSLGAGIVL